MRKSEFRQQIRLDLKDSDPETHRFSDDEIDRGVERAISDCDRILPKESICEVELSFTVSEESFNSATLGSVVQLANKYLEPESEVVTNTGGTVTYVRGVDYQVGYYVGTITCIVGGTMVADTAYKISYNKSSLGVDISSIQNLVRISRVEYPMGRVPQEFVSWQRVGDILTITSTGTTSQSRLSEGSRLGIYYQATNDRPSDDSDGSLPSIFEEVIVKGAGLYLVQSNSIGQLLDAADNLENAQTSLTGSAAAVASAATVLADISGYLSDAQDTLDKVSDNADLGDAQVDKITAVVTTIDAALVEMTGYQADIDDAVQGCLTAWAQTLKYIEGGSGITGAQPHLEAGDDLINAVTVGLDAARLRKEYAETEAGISKILQSQQDTWLLAADKRNLQIQSAAQKVAQKIAVINAYIQAAARYGEYASNFVNEGSVRVGMANALIQEANIHIARAQVLVSNAERYETTSTRCTELAARYREEATDRRTEYLTLLKDKVQWRQEISASSRQQSVRG